LPPLNKFIVQGLQVKEKQVAWSCRGFPGFLPDQYKMETNNIEKGTGQPPKRVISPAGMICCAPPAPCF
jgi:hypothetical protein